MRKIKIIAKPKSAKNQVEKISDNEFRVRLTAPAVDGRANKQLVELLADYFSVPKSAIAIKSGQSSKTKLVIISG